MKITFDGIKYVDEIITYKKVGLQQIKYVVSLFDGTLFRLDCDFKKLPDAVQKFVNRAVMESIWDEFHETYTISAWRYLWTTLDWRQAQ